jgi:hypothetical protein
MRSCHCPSLLMIITGSWLLVDVVCCRGGCLQATTSRAAASALIRTAWIAATSLLAPWRESCWRDTSTGHQGMRTQVGALIDCRRQLQPLSQAKLGLLLHQKDAWGGYCTLPLSNSMLGELTVAFDSILHKQSLCHLMTVCDTAVAAQTTASLCLAPTLAPWLRCV